MAMTWDEYQSAYPAPYDLENFVNQGNQTYANMQYTERPQEWLDEYEKMRRANMEWQANYHNGGYSGQAASTLEMLNPFVNPSGRAYYGAGEPEYIGDAGPQTDWYAEAAAGRPVMGGSVQPNQTAASYYGKKPVPSNVPTQLGQLAYPTGGGLPTPTPNNMPQQIVNSPAYQVGAGNTQLGNIASNLPKATPTNVQSGGTISNFWDNSQQSQGGLAGGGQDMNSLFSKWFKDTYGSSYGQ
jgi:hypothetical protein